MFSEFLGQCDGKPTSNMYISASKYTEKEEAKVLLDWKHRVAGNCILSFERILVLTSTLMQINLFSNMSWISCFCLDASGMMNILLQLKWHRKHQHYWSGNQTVKKKKDRHFLQCSHPFCLPLRLSDLPLFLSCCHQLRVHLGTTSALWEASLFIYIILQQISWHLSPLLLWPVLLSNPDTHSSTFQ